ncbi:MAG TPA: sulfotransferase domain-containing protein [Rhizomicrobium sp.]|jgi:hypothetical protein|nr:sulfotransferase domain-containing protein [Rhizomicrobium sp.]
MTDSKSRNDTEHTIRELGSLFQSPRIAKLRKPNLVGVGAGRCATSYLFGLLQGSRDIYVTPVKEANYFGIHQHPFRRDGMTARDYALLFASQSDQKYIAEITPVYLGHPLALRLIRVELGGIKLIVTLRNPVARFRSQFLYHRPQHKFDDITAYAAHALQRYIPETFNMEWNTPEMALRMSRYSGGVRTAFELFGKENVVVLLYEDLLRDGTSWTRALEKFLGVTLPAEAEPNFRNRGPQADTDFDAAMRKRLIQFFKTDVIRLSQLLGKDMLSYWDLS